MPFDVRKISHNHLEKNYVSIASNVPAIFLQSLTLACSYQFQHASKILQLSKDQDLTCDDDIGDQYLSQIESCLRGEKINA